MKGYRFGSFWLDIQARELFRDNEPVALSAVAIDCLIYLIEQRQRPVGRDELISAVWGRTDVSESTLAHTIVRLRQALNDSGNDQHSIRTMTRLGFRWVAQVEEVASAGPGPVLESGQKQERDEVAAALSQDGGGAGPSSAGQVQPAASALASESERQSKPGSSSLRSVAAIVGALAIVLAAAVWFWPRSQPVVAFHVGNQSQVAWVSPAIVEAPEDWAWLRLGLMDLVANRFRFGALPTVPSKTALALSEKWKPNDRLDPQLGITLRVQPHIEQTQGKWRVSLVAYSNAGGQLRVEASDRDALAAGRSAADALLKALGRTPPTNATSDDPKALLQQVAAARLVGRNEFAMDLLQQAPAEWRALPEARLVSARIDCDRGARQECVQKLDSLLQSKDLTDADVRAQALTSRAWVYGNQADYARAEATLTRALEILGESRDFSTIGNAYSLRGWVRLTVSDLDAAAADLAQARINFLRSGDIRELARTEQRLGVLAGRRNQPAEALGLLNRAAERLERIGAEGDYAVTLMAKAKIQSDLLEHRQALATTDLFWTPETRDDLARVNTRAWVLAENGQVDAAAKLAQQILDQASTDDVVLLAETHQLLALISLWRGNPTKAVEWARLAVVPALEQSDRREYMTNWVVLIRALRFSGQQEQARRETAALKAWADRIGASDLTPGVLLAVAEAHAADGRQAASLQNYELAMAAAERSGMPDDLVVVAASYVRVLVKAKQLDKATLVAGRIGVWAEQDFRAAWTQGVVQAALGDAQAAQATLERAKQLAGERTLPTVRR